MLQEPLQRIQNTTWIQKQSYVYYRPPINAIKDRLPQNIMKISLDTGTIPVPCRCHTGTIPIPYRYHHNYGDVYII